MWDFTDVEERMIDSKFHELVNQGLNSGVPMDRIISFIFKAAIQQGLVTADINAIQETIER